MKTDDFRVGRVKMTHVPYNAVTEASNSYFLLSVIMSISPFTLFLSYIGATTVGTGGDWFPQQCIGPPPTSGRGFKKARNFTASSHQNTGFCI